MPAVTTDQLAGGFIDLSLPKENWTHYAHLRVGLWHAMRYPRAESLDLLRARISAFNQAKGGENTASAGYHETITRFLRACHRAFSRVGRSLTPTRRTRAGIDRALRR